MSRTIENPSHSEANSSSGLSPPTSVRFLTAEELAARYKIPKSQVYRLTREDKIPVVRLGRYVRYPLDQLERWELGQSS